MGHGSMAENNNQGLCVCGDCADCICDSTVSSSDYIEIDNFDQLLMLLLSVKEFLRCCLFPAVFAARFEVLPDKISAFCQAVPYRPPSTELVKAVIKFTAQVRANKRLFDGIVTLTWAELGELSLATENFH